jgi:uncharacterized protein (UPF0276 family)
MAISIPYLGHGVGLRPTHYPAILDDGLRADWFEVISENFMLRGGRPLHVLERVRADRPIVMHGVSGSLGATDPINRTYFDELRVLAARFEPAWVSDHLCWGSYGRHYAHDLLPLPYTEEALVHVVERVSAVQEVLGRQILVENVSSYVAYAHSVMSEWEFLAGVAERADCGILLDVNNIYVSAVNHGFDAERYLAGIPVGRVGQIHLAGHTDNGTHLLDTHDHPVRVEVWDLYRSAVRRFGRISSLVEWDEHIPPFADVLAESERARVAETEVLADVCARTA